MNFGGGSDGGRHTAHGSISSVSSTPFMTPGTLVDTDMTGGGSGHGVSPASASAATAGGGGGQRKERGAIAAQACDTCRSRKQKCDEQRPQCSTCQKFKLACHYREPQPTKKDKTLGEILDRLNTLESKIDLLSIRGGGGQNASRYTNKPAGTDTLQHDLAHLAETPDVFHGFHMRAGSISSPAAAQAPPPPPPPPTGSGAGGYQYSPATYQILGWPAVQQLLAPLEHVGLPQIKSLAVEHQAHAFMLGLHHETAAASLLSASSSNAAMPLPLPHWDTLYRISNAYFDTFNCIAPIVDRTTFFATTLPTVVVEGNAHDHDGSSSSSNSTRNTNSNSTNIASRVLAFLVLALGEVAMADTQGLSLGPRDTAAPPPPSPPSPPSPPGLFFFNRARELMGFVLGESSLEAVQIPALVGIFCSTCLRHMEYWRFTTMASLSCLALIKSNPSELRSPRADVIRRIFWYCLITETHFNIELGLPLTGLDQCEHIVGLPDFSGPYSRDDYLANEASHFQEHYASQIVLCRLCAAFHATLSSEINTGMPQTPSKPPSTPMTPSAPGDAIHASSPPPSAYPGAAQHMAQQLDNWRGMLPPHLRWTDRPDPSGGGYFNSGSMQNSNTVYTRPYALDLQEAILRTRYYSTSYLVHKPFLYKALHAPPDQLSHDDVLGAAACLHACLRWPLTMAPTSAHKRLVPCVFFTTQNILGILVILRLAQEVPILVRIKAVAAAVPGEAAGGGGGNNSSSSSSSNNMTSEGFDRDAQETISLCMAWLQDLRAVDPAAAWAWDVVKGIYHIRE